MKKILFFIVTVLIMTFLGFTFRIFSFIPLLFVVFTGLYRGSAAGCTAGFILGIFNGIFSTTVLGVDSFTYSAAGFLAGAIPDRVDENSAFFQIVISSASVFFAVVMSSVIEVIFISSGNPLDFIHFDTSALLTIFSPAVFIILKKWWGLWFGKLVAER